MENAAKSTGNNFCCSSTARGSSAGVRETSLLLFAYDIILKIFLFDHQINLSIDH